MLNREVDCPIDVMVGPPPSKKEFQCEIDYVEWVRKSMLLAFIFSNQHMGIAVKRQKRDYDRGLKPRDYTPGQWVWRLYPPAVKQKLAMGWTGPYLVLERITYLIYRIQHSENVRAIVVHIDNLEPFKGRHPRNWTDVAIPDEPETLDREENNETPVVGRTCRGREVRPRNVYSPE